MTLIPSGNRTSPTEQQITYNASPCNTVITLKHKTPTVITLWLYHLLKCIAPPPSGNRQNQRVCQSTGASILIYWGFLHHFSRDRPVCNMLCQDAVNPPCLCLVSCSGKVSLWNTVVNNPDCWCKSLSFLLNLCHTSGNELWPRDVSSRNHRTHPSVAPCISQCCSLHKPLQTLKKAKFGSSPTLFPGYTGKVGGTRTICSSLWIHLVFYVNTQIAKKATSPSGRCT